MNEDTFDERELILELFPGTSPALLPPGEVLYYRDAEGRIHIQEDPLHMVFEPIEMQPSVKPVLCEACRVQISRTTAVFVRGVVPNSEGRRFRYLTLCEDTESCRERARPEHLREILRRGILH